eukprot:6043850-Amphidinium_carterae.1
MACVGVNCISTQLFEHEATVVAYELHTGILTQACAEILAGTLWSRCGKSKYRQAYKNGEE